MTKWMLLFAATIALAGCEQAGALSPAIPDSSCAALRIINPSPADTMATKRQVLIHNTIWRKLCQARKPLKRKVAHERPSR